MSLEQVKKVDLTDQDSDDLHNVLINWIENNEEMYKAPWHYEGMEEEIRETQVLCERYQILADFVKNVKEGKIDGWS